MVTQQLTSFIGRTHELAEIAVLLADPACRLLTLVGPGGIGKTRLALEAVNPFLNPFPFHGEGLENRFPNGVHFVPLQPVSDAALLPIAIANAIGIQFFGADEPRVQLLNYLRERQTLLILDNFEHLLDSVDFVVELLTALRVKLLITSRTALNIQAEWRYEIGGLDIPPSPQTPLPHGEGLQTALKDIENFDAVKLFAERARRLRHDFSLDEQRTHVIRICQLTGGMPLALELAAGWIKALSCAEIATEIQRGLDFLAANTHDMPERHRSMAAAFAQSWAMLTESEQAVFRRMSVFRGGFTREAAEKVTGARLHILASLVDKSLLRVSADGRYDVHELLRQDGQAKLQAVNEDEIIHDAHSRYYLDFLAQRSKTIHSQRMIEILDEIEADFDNIRAGWYHAVAKHDDRTISPSIEALSWYCDRHSRLIEHEDLYVHAQKEFTPGPGEQPCLVWAQLMVRRAVFIMLSDGSDEKQAMCRLLYQTSLDVLGLFNDQFETAYATLNWGKFLVGTANPDALFSLEQSLSHFQATEDQFYISECWFWMGLHYRNVNRIEQFFHYMQLSADLKLRHGDKSGAAWGLGEISDTQYDQGDYAAAKQSISEALHLFQEVSNLGGICTSMVQLARRAFWKGDLEEAHDLGEEALKYVMTPSNNYFWVGEILTQIQCVANEDYEQILRHSKNLFKNRSQHLNFLEWMALCGLGHFEQAKQPLSITLGRAKGNRSALVTIQILTIAAIILANQDKEERALETFSLLFAQPIELVGWAKRWGLVTRLLTHLQTNLGDKVYSDAWERGKILNLETAVAEIMAKFDIRDTPTDPNHKLTDPLTPRELDVLRLVAQGHSNRQIGDELVIANTTVRGYVHIICQKLGAQNRTHAVVRAKEFNLL